MKNTFEIHGKRVVIHLFGAGTFHQTTIDLADLPLVSSIPGTWCAYCNHGNWYAHTDVKDSSGKRKTINLHSLLVHPLPGFIIDHADHDGLNNQRTNIRITTNQGNALNRKGANRNNQSGHRGVFFEKGIGKYRAKLGKKYIGSFNTAEEAAAAFDSAFKEFAKVKI